VKLAALLGLVAGCGRVAFDPIAQGSGSDDGGTGNDGATNDVIVDALPVCAAAYTEIAFGSRYRRSSIPTGWLAAEADCESDGGHLAVIQTASENDFIATGGAAPYWLGVTDHLAEGTFREVTGGTAPSTFWSGGEPSDAGGDEDCTHVLGGGAWNDITCSGSQMYFCECDGTPPAATYCDTSQDSDCGECGTTCMVSLICMNQVCS